MKISELSQLAGVHRVTMDPRSAAIVAEQLQSPEASFSAMISPFSSGSLP